MAKRTRKKAVEAADLDVTSFMTLMVVLIPFLLATAVFSQVSIQELNLPTPGAGGSTADTPPVVIEVMVRSEALEIGNGKVITHTLPKQDDEYDLVALGQELLRQKEKDPDKEDISVLLESDVRYRDMIAVMDAVRVYRQRDDEGNEVSSVLFPDIAIGEAP